jgi:hypothetical protein
MSQLSPILRDTTDNGLMFWCPGCDMPHRIQHGSGQGPRWGWNGDANRPTFTPSVLLRWHEGEARTPKCCHSFVTDGQIRFLTDCTHALAGKTVPLPEWRKA